MSSETLPCRPTLVITTDGDEKSLTLTQSNAQRNELKVYTANEEKKEQEHDDEDTCDDTMNGCSSKLPPLHVLPLLWGNEDHIQQIEHRIEAFCLTLEKSPQDVDLALIGSDIIACPYVEHLESLLDTLVHFKPQLCLLSYQERIKQDEMTTFFQLLERGSFGKDEDYIEVLRNPEILFSDEETNHNHIEITTFAFRKID